MKRTLVVLVILLLSGCIFGPSEEREGSGATRDDAGAGDAGAGDAGSDGAADGGACVSACVPSADGYATECVEGRCVATDVCAEGFVDLDMDAGNGCECEVQGEADLPGDNEDADCDGFDGSVAAALFVREGATGSGATADDPMGDLNEALELADGDATISQIVVAGGSYAPVDLVSGVAVVGGYDADFRVFAPATFPTAIEWPESEAPGGDADTVVAEGVDDVTVVGMVIVAGRAQQAGASTFAVRSVNSSGLELRDVRLVGGTAASGADGIAVQSAVQCEPFEGGRGRSVVPDDDPCSFDRAGAGGKGEPSDGGGAGGEGGEHQCVTGAVAQCDPEVLRGEEGGRGANGEAGADGASGEPMGDSLSAGGWVAAVGQPAMDGGRGAGGGGGGAGGNCGVDGEPTFLEGGAGASGGAGGCGGLAGENGQPGGASILALLIGSEVTLTRVEGVPGIAGAGGDGSSGAFGALGESGEVPTRPSGQAGGVGGAGGEGGTGGRGGHGAGGCAGPSYGVAYDAGSTLSGELEVAAGDVFEPGEPGAGAEGAPDGCDGVGSVERRFE